MEYNVNKSDKVALDDLEFGEFFEFGENVYLKLAKDIRADVDLSACLELRSCAFTTLKNHVMVTHLVLAKPLEFKLYKE